MEREGRKYKEEMESEKNEKHEKSSTLSCALDKLTPSFSGEI